jgi:hypothetical protein
MVNNLISIRIKKYISFISDFISEKKPVEEFISTYFQMVKNEKTFFSDEVYKTIGTLFSDVDSFCDDPNLWEEGDLTLGELQHRATIARDELEDWIRSQ